MKTTRDIKNKPFKSAGIEQTCFDNSLKSIIRDELPDAPADEWFTRKVMNRLPETRQRAKVSLPERICYISGAFLLVAAWIYSIMFATTCSHIVLYKHICRSGYKACNLTPYSQDRIYEDCIQDYIFNKMRQTVPRPVGTIKVTVCRRRFFLRGNFCTFALGFNLNPTNSSLYFRCFYVTSLFSNFKTRLPCNDCPGGNDCGGFCR